MSKTLTWPATDVARPWSATLLYFVAAVLHRASQLAVSGAARLSVARDVGEPAPQVVEFHALHREAGAPEGALYVNGEFVGTLEGVTRL